MQINFKPPPPLVVGEGDSAITILLRRWTGSERLSVVDAAQAGSNMAVQCALDPLVIGIGGVADEDGTPIVLEKPGEGGKPTRQFDAIMGALPFEVQKAAIEAICEFIGVKEPKTPDRPTPHSDGATPPSAPAN